MDRPKTKNLNCMQDPVDNFSKPGQLVLNLFSATSSSTKKCLDLSGYRHLVAAKLMPISAQRKPWRLRRGMQDNSQMTGRAFRLLVSL